MRQEEELALVQVAQISDRLTARHPEMPRQAIETAVREVYQGYGGSRVRDFVPLLVERDAARRLTSLLAAHPGPAGT